MTVLQDAKPEELPITVGEVRDVSVDFTDSLESGQTLSGTPTVTEATATITISNQQLNAAEVTIQDRTVAANSAVIFTADASSAVAGTLYKLTITVDTSSSGRNRKRSVHLRARNP